MGRSRAIRLAAAAALVLWGLLGLVHTAVVLARPVTGWRLLRQPGAERAIGVPREQEDGSRLVTEALTLLEAEPDGAGAVWVVRTDRLHQDTWWYVQYQLAHLLYPRPVLLMTPDSAVIRGEAVGRALGFDGDTPGAGWRRLGSATRVALYARAR